MPGHTEGSSRGCPAASEPPQCPARSIKALHGPPGRGTVPGVGVGRWGPGP